MQEIKKRRIVLASILKPVNDPRMFEKLGETLSAVYEVHVIGHSTDQPPAHNDITQHPLGAFNRISFARFLAPVVALRKILQIKPTMLIVCTHELLVVGAIAKIFTGCRLFYDVQENYARNIYYGLAFPAVFRPLLAAYVRLKERALSGIYHHFLLAERSYERELSFLNGRYTVLENKSRQGRILRAGRSKDENKIRLLFSGTLAETTGVFIAIDIATRLHALDSRIQLLVIGYAAQASTRSRLRSEVQDKHFILLQGIDHIVAHGAIEHEIATAHFGFISYPPNRSTQSSMPTKLFEYLGNHLPVLLIAHKPWITFCEKYPAAVVFDPSRLDVNTMLKEMLETNFYQNPAADVYWATEGEKLLKAAGTALPDA